MLTEEEAGGKWCPQSRSADHGGANRGGYGTSDGINICIGSRCMAWRWVVGPLWETGSNPGYSHGTGDKTKQRGYCGLAGQVSA